MDPELEPPVTAEISLVQTEVATEPFDDPSSPSGFENDIIKDAQSTVLGNEDLLTLVFSFHTLDPSSNSPKVDTNSKQDGKLKDLLQASLTCKTFFHPAIRAMWKSIDSIVPLVKLISGVVEDGTVLTTSEAILEEDLQRFDFYARFVQQFNLSVETIQDGYIQWNDGCISGHILPTIYHYRPQGLLPFLKVLKIAKFVDNLSFLIPMFPTAGADSLSAGLSELVLEGLPIRIVTGGRVIAASILKIVQLKSPCLTSLTLKGGQDSAVFNVIKGIKSLKSISLDFSTSDIHSSTSDIAQSSKTAHHSATDLGASFSLLVNLHLTGTVSSILVVVGLAFGETPNLQNLKLSFVSRHPEERGQQDLFVSLLDKITKWEDVSLESFVIDRDPKTELQICQASLQYFTRPIFNKLKTLSIPRGPSSPGPFISRLNPLGESLEQLYICSNYLPRGSTLWLGVLGSIQRMFPRLKHVYIPISLGIDPSLTEIIKRTLQSDSTCHGLKVLGLQPFTNIDPPVPPLTEPEVYPTSYHPSRKTTDLLLVARYVDHLFPHLQKIDIGKLRPFVKHDWLDGFEAAVKDFAEVRMRSTEHQGVCMES